MDIALVECGLRGHELVGTGAAHVRPQDALLVRESDGLRWYRCLRCDAWLPLPPPAHPTTDHVPDRAAIALPLRDRALRDRWALRLIALDRALHCVVLTVLAAAVLLFLDDRARLAATFARVQAPAGAGLLGELARAFAASRSSLLLVAGVLAGYAALEGAEAVGLWLGRRWAEYLTIVATALLLVPEIAELTRGVTPLKVLALVVNLAVVAYLVAKHRRRRAPHGPAGWAAVERATPAAGAVP